jgi:hypothetical protein
MQRPIPLPDPGSNRRAHMASLPCAVWAQPRAALEGISNHESDQTKWSLCSDGSVR